MGSSTENSAFGPARNPSTRHGSRAVPAGAARRRSPPASPRSASAATPGIDPPAGGAVRGRRVKPTYGVVSRMGLVAFASSLDQIGPFATTVADAALALEVIGGHDPATPRRSAPAPTCAVLDDGVEGLRGADHRPSRRRRPRRRRAGRCRLRRPQRRRGEDRRRRGAGVHLRADGLLPRRPVEASSNLARYDGVRYGLRAPPPTPTRCTWPPGRPASATR